MRGVRLAVLLLLLTAALAGCVDDDEGDEEGVVAQQPSWPTGLLFTYEVTTDGERSNETFLVRNASGQGPELAAWNLSRPNLTSPFLTWNENYNPRSAAWASIFEYPIEAGDEHEARLDGTEVNLTWSEVPHEGPLGTDTDIEGVARLPAGEEVARFRVSTGNDTAVTLIDLDLPDGPTETWRLVDAELRTDWDEPPRWEKGDWWTYNGSFQGEEGNATLVYTHDQQTRQADQRILSPVRFDDRLPTLPLHGWRDSDIAPQSGFVTAMLQTFWSWPLADGTTWGGTTSAVDGGGTYEAVAELVERATLPDGSASVAFAVEVFVPDHEEPFAEYTYAPRVGHLVDWRISEAGSSEPELAYTLEAWGEGFHGEMEIPERETPEEIPVTSGPASIERSFDVPEEAIWVRIAPHSFAGHGQDVEPEFELEITDANGTVKAQRDESHFSQRRLDLSGRMEASPGTWNLTLEMGEGVSARLVLEALWFETETVDFR